MKKRRKFEYYLIKVISKEEKGLLPFLILSLLSILEIIYLVLLNINRLLAKSRSLPVPVVSIGNIVAGGTGKTPTVVWLVDFLKKAGYNPAILTRGYGAAAEDGLVFDNSLLKELSPKVTGDEPYLLAGLLPGTVIAVGRDRYRMGLKALEVHPEIDVFVMDDGFQYLKLKKDLDLVILDALQPFGNGHLIPRGTLREPLLALKRTDLILLTRTAKADPVALQNLTAYLKKLNSEVPIGIIKEEYSHLLPLDQRRQEAGFSAKEFLNGRKVAAITGIGNPRQFLASLEDLGAEVGYFKAYPDHYVWDQAEITNLIETLKDWKFEDLIVTGKDGVKLASFKEEFIQSKMNCLILSLEYAVADQEIYDTLLKVLPRKVD